MTNVYSFLKKPIPFRNICTIYPPSIDNTLDDKFFGIYRTILTMSQEDIEDQIFGVENIQQLSQIDRKDIPIPTPFDYLIIEAHKSKENEKLIKDAFYFFIKEEINFLWEEQAILVGKLEQVLLAMDSLETLPLITEENYFDFQNLIRASLGEDPIEPPDLNIHPKLREMKAKARYRDRIKAKQGNGMSFCSTLASICCMGIGLNPLNIGEISYASMRVLIEKFQMRERYDIDIRSLQAGADKKDVKPKYWMNDSKKEKSNY